MKIRERIAQYTSDPLVGELWHAIRRAKPLRSISVDVTRKCNLRCKGCYFFVEGMDKVDDAASAEFDHFIMKEEARGTNFVTVLGGEPSLAQDRVLRLAEHFKLVIVTNGVKPLPWLGLEDTTIAISVWGDRETDRRLRGYDRINIFERALAHYRSDPRVVWYMTLPSSPSEQTEESVAACIENGNLVGFNYYGDLEGLGGSLDHGAGFSEARRFVEQMLARYPGHIAFGKYLNQVVTTGEMKGSRWGYDVCGSVSVDDPANKTRLANGHSFNPHFNAYGPGLGTPRRCCVGSVRDCNTCRDVWAHMSWIALALERHLDSAEDFYAWISTMYVFYGVCGLVDRPEFRARLAEINSRDAGLAMRGAAAALKDE
ncbi:radical SAM protein [Mesorhizobium sp. M0618]|uniref:radical SAM protein n=1 Tax=unclassified Mesorhizobium TaxID=325217 RepID=UPI00333CE635